MMRRYNTIPMKKSNNIRIALVHDFLLYPGGAEKVLEVFAEMFPEAPIYTLLYDKKAMKGLFKERDVQTSFLQKLPKWLRKRHRWLLPFYATAVETFDLRDFDVVISSSGAWSKGLVTKLKTQHIAYIHSPMRYIWDYNEKYWKDLGKKPSLCVKMYLQYLRMWDRLAADRPDFLVVNSRYTKDRVEKYYRRGAEVIYPPVSTKNEEQKMKNKKTKKDYFLIVSRLTENKRINMAIEAFNKLGLPLRIVGEGPARKKLQEQARENIKFFGWLEEDELKQQYANAKAFVHPSEEDFGIAAVEALQYGIPVIALRKGGVVEFMEEGVTGELFDAQVPGVLADAVRRFLECETYNVHRMKEAGNQFSKERFKQEFMEFFKKSLNT